MLTLAVAAFCAVALYEREEFIPIEASERLPDDISGGLTIHRARGAAFPKNGPVMASSKREYRRIDWEKPPGAAKVPLPKGINFKTTRLAVIGDRLPSGTSTIEIVGVFDRPDAYEIVYMQTTPEVHDDMISSETLIIELPADDKPVDVIKLGADNTRSSKDAPSRVR